MSNCRDRVQALSAASKKWENFFAKVVQSRQKIINKTSGIETAHIRWKQLRTHRKSSLISRVMSFHYHFTTAAHFYTRIMSSRKFEIIISINKRRYEIKTNQGRSLLRLWTRYFSEHRASAKRYTQSSIIIECFEDIEIHKIDFLPSHSYTMRLDEIPTYRRVS